MNPAERLTRTKRLAISIFLFAAAIGTTSASERKDAKTSSGEQQSSSSQSTPAVLWKEPENMAARNLLYGIGGENHLPPTSFVFVKEDTAGSNPKFDVKDQDGVKWKIKLGPEARSETAASRFVWAAGYFTDEDYFVRDLSIESMPKHLKRGDDLIGPGGRVRDARLERSGGQEKVGQWKWSKNPFTGTRQLNGLRVVMALINNWDVKDQNNAIYESKDGHASRVYAISDLGASFGPTGIGWRRSKARANLKAYSHSNFISKITPEYVDFAAPSRPGFLYLATLPQFIQRIKLRWVGDHIPRSDAKWMGDLLGQLSHQQICDAFIAAGYAPADVEAFASVIEERIGQLKKL